VLGGLLALLSAATFAFNNASLRRGVLSGSVAHAMAISVPIGVPIFFGYNVRADMDEEVVYQMLTVFNDNIDRLVEGDPGFRPLAADFVGTQAAGVAANPDIPVHPGLARFLQEHDAWNDEWIIADATG
jgi:uncharacterized protein